MSIMLLTVCIVTWGMAMFLMKIAGQMLGPYTALLFTLPGYLLIIPFAAGRANFNLSARHALPVVIGMLYTIGNIAYYRLCETQDVSRIAPATALYVAITVILGWVLLREDISMQRVLGIVFAGLALYLLSAPERGGILR